MGSKLIRSVQIKLNLARIRVIGCFSECSSGLCEVAKYSWAHVDIFIMVHRFSCNATWGLQDHAHSTLVSTLGFYAWDFSGVPESFHNMYCRWGKSQSLCSLALKYILFKNDLQIPHKVLHNLWAMIHQRLMDAPFIPSLETVTWHNLTFTQVLLEYSK